MDYVWFIVYYCIKMYEIGTLNDFKTLVGTQLAKAGRPLL